jgi:hypothetical protein
MAGLAPPGALFAPVLPGTAAQGAGTLTPSLDGVVDPADEWRRAIALRPAGAGVMQRSTRLPIGDLRFGWDVQALYFLVEPGRRLEDSLEVAFYLLTDTAQAEPQTDATPGAPRETPNTTHGAFGAYEEAAFLAPVLGFRPSWLLTLELAPSAGPQAPTVMLWRLAEEAPAARLEAAPIRVTAGAVVEAAVPWDTLAESRPRMLSVGAALYREGTRIETFPSSGAVETRVFGV